MKVIRGKPATGKPPKIICAGCGKKAVEAGIAVKPEVIEGGHGPDGPVKIIDESEHETFPLCEDCVTVLERAR